MRNKHRKNLYIAVSMLAAFVLWTAAVSFLDVQAIGPQGSTVGLAAVNQSVHSRTGVHMALYRVTDWLGLVPLCFMVGFALLGLIQWIRRKALLKVDFSILVLGGFYAVMMALYVFFEVVVINHRPILIDGVLEASYPSSTTMLVLCVMPTALIQLHARMRKGILKRCIRLSLTAFTLFMVIGRLLSGVHWFSDIMGGILLSGGLVTLYSAIIQLKEP